MGILLPDGAQKSGGAGVQSACDAPSGSLREEPASHGVTELAPAPHQPPTSHAPHAVALDDDWYSPAAQSSQVLALSPALNWPGAHAIESLERARQ